MKNTPTGVPTDLLRAFLLTEDPPHQAGDRVGRFRLVKEIGRGGMAVVFEAVDEDLDRPIAVKVLLSDALERARQEARTAAGLHHPNIVTIHEVGNDFIAMELIRGQTLAEVWRGMQAADRVRTLLTVAKAVAHAHARGVVHGDLKPDNVLVESGSGRIVLTDFGLGESRRSAEMPVARRRPAGTAPYMAPELLRGDSSASRWAADVWGLGVMLFQAVTSVLPFTGRDAQEILGQIEARPAPAVNGPLGQVVQRALESNPAARFRDANAFADALAAVLTAQAARSRLRRRLLVSVLGLAVASVVIAKATEWRSRTAVVDALRRQAKTSVEAALGLQRAGANAQMRQFLPPLEAAYEEASRRAPAAPEVDYLMGRMHRALLDTDRSLAFQDLAIAKDPTYGPALYERAVLLSLKNGRTQSLVPLVAGNPPAPPPPGDVVAQAWRTFLATEHIVRDAQSVREEWYRLGNAFSAFIDGRTAQARSALQALLESHPDLDEGWELLSYVARADQSAAGATKDQAQRDQEALLTARLEQNRGSVPLYLGRAALYRSRAARAFEKGTDPAADLALAEADLERARALGGSPQISTLIGQLQIRHAEWLLRNRRDPRPRLATAQESLARALREGHGDAQTHRFRAFAHQLHGTYLEETGQDGRPQFVAASEALDAALAQNAPPPYLRFMRVRLLGRWAYAEGRRGGDYRHLITEADGEFEKLLAGAWKPTAYDWGVWAGIALDDARVRTLRGEDPLPALEQARKRVERAIVIDRNSSEALRWSGLVRLALGEHQSRTGHRTLSRATFAAAAADLTQALALNPASDLQDELATAKRGAVGIR